MIWLNLPVGLNKVVLLSQISPAILLCIGDMNFPEVSGCCFPKGFAPFDDRAFGGPWCGEKEGQIMFWV